MRTEDGQEIVFLRGDGTPAQGPVGKRGYDENTGEVLFYELHDSVKPSVNGKDTFQRFLVQRVFPYVKQ